MGALIRGAGHMPPVDRPDAFAAAVDGFLAEIAHAGIEHTGFVCQRAASSAR
jgi:hypothetical protein